MSNELKGISLRFKDEKKPPDKAVVSLAFSVQGSFKYVRNANIHIYFYTQYKFRIKSYDVVFHRL